MAEMTLNQIALRERSAEQEQRLIVELTSACRRAIPADSDPMTIEEMLGEIDLIEGVEPEMAQRYWSDITERRAKVYKEFQRWDRRGTWFTTDMDKADQKINHQDSVIDGLTGRRNNQAEILELHSGQPRHRLRTQRYLPRGG